MLRGRSPAKIDEKGRLKVPAAFRALIEQQYGSQLFVTSLDEHQSVRIYPMPVWQEIERKLAALPTTLAARNAFLETVNFNGQVCELDKQGRVLISPYLRESAEIIGEVDVLGMNDYLEVWNHLKCVARRTSKRYSEQDAEALSKFGI